MIRIPVLRHGEPYTSLETVQVPHYRTRAPFAEISQANVGLIRRDLLPDAQAAARRALTGIPIDRLLEICRETADRFANGTLPIGSDTQTRDDYIEQVSATTGMPYVLVRRNMDRIAAVLREMPTVLRGLTRGLDLQVLDTGVGEANGHTVSFFPRGAHAGRRPAEQLTRRALALDSRHRAEDAAGAQAGRRRAVDSVPDRAGLHRGWRAAGGVRLLPDRPRRRRRDSSPVGPQHVLRRRIGGRRGRGRSAHRAARAGLQQGAARRRTRSTPGATTSISLPRRSPTTAADRA